MTIASEIERLQDVRTDIYDELGNKCVNLDDSSKYADVAPIIKKMPVVCAKIGANKYPVVKIGNQLWTAKNLDEDLGTIGTNEWYYNGRTEKTRLNVTTEFLNEDPSHGYFYNSFVFDFYSGKKTSNQKNCELCFKYYRLIGTIEFETAQNVDRTLFARITGVQSGVYAGKTFVIPSGTTSYNFDLLINVSDNDVGKTFNRIDIVFSTNTIGKLSLKNFRAFGSNSSSLTDGGTNAIDVPTALANEATYKKYGRLYTWDNVNTNLASLGLQGWRMPTKADFDALVDLDSTGKKFRAKSFANGTDDFGFNELPSGIWNTNSQSFTYFGSRSSIWALKYEGALFRAQFDSNSFTCLILQNSTNGFSVRLVCDLNEDGSIPDGAVIIAEADESVATLSEDGVEG